MNFSKKNHEYLSNKNGLSKTLKSILIITTVVFSFFNANATVSKTNLSKTTINTVLFTDDLVEVFDWSVKTTIGEFSGTASNLLDAKRRANIVGQNTIVLEQKITTYYVLKNEIKSKSNRVYFWEVKSQNGYAKGFSKEKHSAKHMIHLIAKGDIISYRIIASKNL